MKKTIITVVSLVFIVFAAWYFYPSFSYKGVYCNGELGPQGDIFVVIDDNYTCDVFFSGPYKVNPFLRRLTVDVRDRNIPNVDFIPVKLRWNAIQTVFPLQGMVKIQKLKGNPDPWAVPVYSIKTDDVELMTIAIDDCSSDYEFPSDQDTQWVVTNREDVVWLHELLKKAVDSTAQTSRFGASVGGGNLRLGFKIKGQNKESVFFNYAVTDDNPVYFNACEYGYIAVDRREELIAKLLELGVPESAISGYQ